MASDTLREALARLVELKDGPRDDAYRASKAAAWQAARDALADHPETDDGEGQDHSQGGLSPSSLAGHREPIMATLRIHTVECTGPGEVTCSACRDRGWMSWWDYHSHVTDALLATLVDLGSEETQRRAYQAAHQAWQHPSEVPADFAAEISAAVLAALTSGEQP